MKTDDKERIFLDAVERMSKESSAAKHTNPKRMKFVLVACVLALICSLVGNVVQHNQNIDLSRQVDALENQYSKKTRRIRQSLERVQPRLHGIFAKPKRRKPISHAPSNSSPRSLFLFCTNST